MFFQYLNKPTEPVSIQLVPLKGSGFEHADLFILGDSLLAYARPTLAESRTMFKIMENYCTKTFYFFFFLIWLCNLEKK